MTGGWYTRDGEREGTGHVQVEEHGVARLHAAILREMAEPRDGREPTPLWLVFGAMLLLGWGGWYLGTYDAGFRADAYDEKPGAGVRVTSPSPVTSDPLVLGKRIFNNCQACHQADGRGVPGNFPPLAGSEWVIGRPDTLVRIVLHGAQGPLAVRGTSYNQVMPAWKHLSDAQLIAVLSYVRSAWGNQASALTAEMVAAVRASERGRNRPWTAAELREAEVARPLAGPARVGAGAEPSAQPVR